MSPFKDDPEVSDFSAVVYWRITENDLRDVCYLLVFLGGRVDNLETSFLSFPNVFLNPANHN